MDYRQAPDMPEPQLGDCVTHVDEDGELLMHGVVVNRVVPSMSDWPQVAVERDDDSSVEVVFVADLFTAHGVCSTGRGSGAICDRPTAPGWDRCGAHDGHDPACRDAR